MFPRTKTKAITIAAATPVRCNKLVVDNNKIVDQTMEVNDNKLRFNKLPDYRVSR